MASEITIKGQRAKSEEGRENDGGHGLAARDNQGKETGLRWDAAQNLQLW